MTAGPKNIWIRGHVDFFVGNGKVIEGRDESDQEKSFGPSDSPAELVRQLTWQFPADKTTFESLDEHEVVLHCGNQSFYGNFYTDDGGDVEENVKEAVIEKIRQTFKPVTGPQ
jgi:hypothetical protein